MDKIKEIKRYKHKISHGDANYSIGNIYIYIFKE